MKTRACATRKLCSKCNETKSISDFHNNKSSRDGKTSRCKVCRTEAASKWNRENWDRYRENTNRWVNDNKDRVLIHSRRMEKKRIQYHKEKHRIYFLRKQKEMPELYFLKCQAHDCYAFYYNKNGGSKSKYCSKGCQYKVQHRRDYSKVKNRLSTAMRMGIKRGLEAKYQGRTFDALGFSLDDLIQHLSSQFTKGMTLENHGEWHIDHIRPVASFDYDSVDHPDFKKCWALDNLQPLWAKDNLSKGAKWDGKVNV